MIVSVTEIMAFQRCRRAWSYSSANGESLGPIVPRRALSLGKTMHRAWAAWLVEPEASLPELFLHAAADELAKIRTAYVAAVGAPISQAELGEYYDGVALGQAMAENYQRKWGSPLPAGYTLVQPEQQFTVPIPVHHVNIYSAEPPQLACRLDAIIRRDKTGGLCVLEHKTYSYRPKIDVLQQAFQFVAYEWALSQLDIGDVEGTAYDGIWSRATPPRGSTFDDLFTRMQITHTPTHLADVEATIRDCVTDMSNDPLIYPNRTWMGCTDCSAFERLCAAQSAGEDTTWMRQTQFVRLDVDREPVLED